MSSLLSRVGSQAQHEHFDTLINQGVNLGLVAGTPTTLLSTYTVGAGRVSTLEHLHLRCGGTGAPSQAIVEVSVSRSGGFSVLAEMFSVVVGVQSYTTDEIPFNLKLNAGDYVQFRATNSSGATVYIAVTAFYREVIL